jgi:tRNA A-37 threonylcarbamoyl transferase component Bud32
MAPATEPTTSSPGRDTRSSVRTQEWADGPRPSSHFDDELRRLLRERLLFVTGIVSAILGVSLLSIADGNEHALTFGASRTTAVVFDVSMLLSGAAFGWVIWRKSGLSLARFRQLEVAHFGVFSVACAALKYQAFVGISGDSPDPRFVWTDVERVATESNQLFLFMLMFHGVLIPNARRRAWQVIFGLSAGPLLATVLAALENPAFRPHLGYAIGVTGVGMALAGVVTVFGASRILALQRQAFDARRETEQLGPYALVRKLGEGGMGEVWLAEHRLMKRPCAVKFIRPEHAANPSAAARFEREVRAMTALTHFHTIRVYDYGRADDGGFYYVMEYLDGPTLEGLVREFGPLEPSRAVYLLRQLCGALAEAHAAGLVHRDLKPGNVIVAALGGQRDVAKLLDFGLVHDTGSDADVRLTRTGTVVGTPAYMCPEQAGGEPNIDARGDVYSLGAVAFFALTGRPPFDEANVGKMLSAHLTRTPPRVDELRPEVPADLADVVALCLEKMPGDRLASAAELELALGLCGCARNWNPARAAVWWDVN